MTQKHITNYYLKEYWKDTLKIIIVLLIIIYSYKFSFLLGVVVITLLVMFPQATEIVKGKEYSSKHLMYKRLKKVGKVIIIIAILNLLFIVSSWLGLVGGLILWVSIILWRMHKKKDFFMEQMRKIETNIWGKPLDKENWEYPGEWRKYKLKPVLRKKNETKKV